MRRFWRSVTLVALGAVAGAALWYFRSRPAERAPDPPSVVVRLREVARLTALDVSLYKKVSFEPAPRPADSIWGDLAGWARHTLRPPRGKAIVFADAHLSLDLRRFDDRSLRVSGKRVEVVLPPVVTSVELKPGDTEVIGSNLDSSETAALLEEARSAFAREVSADPRLRAKAREAAESALRELLFALGFEQVMFVDAPRLGGET
jgi:hypothetical protein